MQTVSDNMYGQVASMFVQTTCNTLSAYYMQNVVCHVVRRNSSAIKFDRVKIAYILAFILLAETIKWWRICFDNLPSAMLKQNCC